MVTTLLQLHHDVQETRRAAFGTFTQSLVVPGQDPPGHTHTETSLNYPENQISTRGSCPALTCNTVSGWRSSPL